MAKKMKVVPNCMKHLENTERGNFEKISETDMSEKIQSPASENF